MRVLPCGDRAALVELDDLTEVLGLHAALRADPPAGATEFVPAARTVLVRFDPASTDIRCLADDLVHRDRSHPGHAGSPAVDVPVRYDGADLAEVAELTGLSARELVTRHQAAEYEVAFAGFAPGFAYVTGIDPALRVPRRSTPRTSVPAGAVAIAGQFTAVYPRTSPGGWRILGYTDLRVWNLDRDPPMLLAPGTRVRFVEEPS